MNNPLRFHFGEITSTNDYAKELIFGNDLIIVTANGQLQGRGRKSKKWVGDYGKNIFMTFGINHEFIEVYETPAMYQAMGSLSVIKTLRKIAPDNLFKVKYPNDIYILSDATYKKISGVLVEQSYTGIKADISLIGIGVNNEQDEFPQELKAKATSLYLNGLIVDNDQLSELLVDNLLKEFERSEDDIRKEWLDEMNLIGKRCEIVGKGFWNIIEVLPDGRLEVECETNKLIIDNGDSIIYDLT